MTVLGKNNVFKRIAAFVLAVLMVFSLVPFDTSVAKAEDGEGTETSVAYIFNVYESIDGKNIPIDGATISIYSEGYDGTDIGITAKTTATTSAGAANVTLADYKSVEETKNFVYVITYTKVETSDEGNETSRTVYATSRGMLGTDTNINVEMKPAVGISGTLCIGNENTVATQSFDVRLMKDGNEVAKTKSCNNGSFIFDTVDFDASANEYKIEVQTTEYTPTSSAKTVTNFDGTVGVISEQGTIVLEEKVNTVNLSFSDTTKEIVYGTSYTNTITYDKEGASLDTGIVISYASDNKDVVTVNETTGEVSTVGVGKANITATFCSDNYKEAKASYEVTVTGFGIAGTVNTVVNGTSTSVQGEKIYLLNGTVTTEGLKNTDLSSAKTTVTKADGTYEFLDLIPGNYTVVVDSENYKDAILNIEVVNAGLSNQDITLSAKEEVILDVIFQKSEVELLTNLELSTQNVTNSLTFLKDNVALTEEQMKDYKVSYSVDTTDVITIDSSTGAIKTINSVGTATVSVSISSDTYKVNTGSSTLQYVVKVWTLAFEDEELTGNIEKTYGDALFSTKAILKGVGSDTKEVSITYVSTNPDIAQIVYVDAEGKETEETTNVTDVKVKLVGTSNDTDDDETNNSSTISATYNGATITYNVKVNPITTLEDFVWQGYDETTDVDESGNIVVDYVYAGVTKEINVAEIEGVTIQYTSSDTEKKVIEIDEDTGAILSINGVGDDIKITASVVSNNYDIEPITYTINVGKGIQTGLDWKAEDLKTVKENTDTKYKVTENVETGKLEQIEVTYKKGIAGFTLAAQNAIESGMSYEYSVEYPNGSTNLNVATVDEDGFVTINGAGSVIIKCTATDNTNSYYESYTIDYKLVVNKAEQSIVWKEIDWINPDDLSIPFINESITVEYQNGLEYDLGITGQIEDDDLTFGFSTLDASGIEKNDIATVDGTTGKVKVNCVGDVYIWYKSYNDNKYIPCEMKYHLIVEHGKQPLVWNTEDMGALDAIAMIKNAEGAEVTTLPETGGTVGIVYNENNNTYQLDVDGENKDLTYTFTVTGNEDGVITLDETNGTVTINKAGKVVITYKATNATANYETKEMSYTLEITENPQTDLKWDKTNVPNNIEISQLSDTSGAASLVYAEDFVTFKIDVTGQIKSNNLSYGFVEQDTDVATVAEDGTISIKKAGSIEVTYASKDKSSGHYTEKILSYTLTIKKADQTGFLWDSGKVSDSVILTYNKDDLIREDSLKATTPKEEMEAQLTYSIVITEGNSNAIEIEPTTGVITIHESGKATVTASIQETTNYNGTSIHYTLVVNRDNQKIKFANSSYSFTNGGRFTFPTVSSDKSEASGAYTYTVESDVNGVIASINKNTGELSFTLQPGEVTIKVVRAGDDKYKAAEATYTLTVKAWNPLSSGNIGTYYSITGTKEDVTSPWYTKADVNHPIRLVAANGYQLYKGTTDPTPSTTWSSYIDISDIHEGKANGIVYYIREISTGYVSKQYAINNIHVDTTAPGAAIIVDDATIWEKVLSFFTFDIFGQNTPELAISSSDETSGVKSVYYYVSNSLEPLESNGLVDASALEKEATWKTYSGKVDLLNENVAENVIYTKVIDNAGNVTYASTNGLIFDGAKPVVTPTIVTKDVNGLYNGNVEINLDVVDTAPYSGIQEITYVVENTGTITDKGTLFTFSPAQAGNPKKSELISSWNSADYGKNVIVKAADNNSDNVKVTFTVTDNAGNTTESIVDLKIDITAPAINVQYNNNAGDTSFVDSVYYNSDRMATITVKDRHFDANRVKLTITNTDGVIPGLSEWTKISSGTGNGDDTTYVATVYFTADGDYTFDISCADIAENTNTPVNYGVSQAPTAFTIDKIAPTISISYDNNDALNENYFKADRTATVVIHEHNFDASRVNAMITATDDGQDIAAPAISGWSSSGDTHTAYINYSSDALYTFDIDYTDKAGNVMADVAPQTFYVDKTTPQVSITEIVDLSANNAEKIGFVITATDTNFDVFTPVLTAVTQTENGFATTEMDVASIAEITNGQVYTVDNLEADGIYSITCSAIDKAGNAYTEVNLQRADGSTYVESRAGEDTLIMFSVNRLGSTFDIDANTKDILDKYYVQNVENDLVIYEVNTNELLSYSISLNGEELTEGTDYTVSNSGGNGEWMRYTYTVNKNLFENEGEYVLVISSTDGAENNAFSDVKNANISFVVDRTAPVVTVTGMESGRSYQTDKQTVTLMPTDDGGIIETLMVRLVDRDGNVLEEILNMSGDKLREALETNAGTITFDLSEGLNQNIQIICGDGSYNAQGQPNTFNQTFEDVSVSASALAIFFAGNTMLYIGGGAGAAAVGGGVFFFRRRKFPKLNKKK